MNCVSIYVSALAFRHDCGNKISELENALATIPSKQINIVLLPGYSFDNGVVNHDREALLINLAAKFKFHIFAETEVGSYHIFSPDGKAPIGPFVQLFSNHRNAIPDRIHELIHQISTGERVVTIKGIRFALLLCGENNVLSNKQSKNNEPSVRHTNIDWPFTYDVLFNPAHTTMGNWNKLDKRFSMFSADNRMLFYCANNTKKSSWKSSICVYYNGNKILSADNATSKALNWRLLTVEIKLGAGRRITVKMSRRVIHRKKSQCLSEKLNAVASQ